MIYMPVKSAAILMLVLGIICLVDGFIKMDGKELLVAIATLSLGIYKLVTAIKKTSESKKLQR